MKRVTASPYPQVCIRTACVLATLWVVACPSWGVVHPKNDLPPSGVFKTPIERDGKAEARLVEIYQLIGNGLIRPALSKADALVKDYPHFQLAQLIYGDLLKAQVKPVRMLGDMPNDLSSEANSRLQELREESQLRITALRQRPPAGLVPSQLTLLSPRNKHAIAIDVSKARLYLFENTRRGVELIADYYISVGRAGVGKSIEGDQRTPLGLYFITSNLDPKSLKDLYGSGALPINYPNAFDIRRGKSGSGIWLHGTPSTQFARAPLATDGCVAVSNPDLERIIRTVEIRTTPVVISPSLKWVSGQSLAVERKSFEDMLQSWATAKTSGEFYRLTGFYAPDFTADDKTLVTQAQLKTPKQPGTRMFKTRLSDISLLRSTGDSDILVATFGVVDAGEKSGRTVRQYWERRNNQWKIVYEGVVG